MQPNRRSSSILVAIALLGILDGVVWGFIFAPRASASEFALYFLDISQGDGGLITFPGDVQVVIDGGPPNGRLLSELSQILPPHDRYIDLVMLSHPQLDHFGGFIDLFKTYEVGMVLTNGVKGATSAYAELAAVIREKGIREIILGAGDRIQYGTYVFDVLSPAEHQIVHGDLNESGLVVRLTARGEEGAGQIPLQALYTADIGAKTEAALARDHDLHAQVLKVGHHGSRFSSSAEFLREVSPQVAAIGVGKNTYGHPTRDALDRLVAAGARVFRTDRDGTVKITLQDGTIDVFTRRSIAPR